MITEYAPRLHSDEELSQIALYPILERAAREVNPTSYLEIGCREGDSLIRVLRNAPSLKTIIVADLWDGNYGGTERGGPDHILRLLKASGYRGFFASLNGRSQDTLPSLTSTFDLILVDGDHSEYGAARDLESAWRMLCRFGILVFDDICNPKHPYLGEVLDNFIGMQGAELLEKSTVGVGAASIRKVVQN